MMQVSHIGLLNIVIILKSHIRDRNIPMLMIQVAGGDFVYQYSIKQCTLRNFTSRGQLQDCPFIKPHRKESSEVMAWGV